MKNLTKLLGIIALAAVIGFAMAGCEQPTDSTTTKTLTDITLNTDSVKKAYIQNETLDLSGLIVTANYSDGSKAAVASYIADPASGATLSAIETKTVTVSYTEETVTKTADFSVTVAAKALSGITANYTNSTTHVYTFTPLDSLKDHLAVTAQYNDGTSATLDAEDYTLSGTLTVGTSAITASYTEGGVTKTDAFDVTVTAATLDGIAVAFDQDDETIYTSTPRDNLKQYLTVTATYTFIGSQETHEETLSAHEYTLSGELTVGAPTITVNYGGKTGNFTPTVTAVVLVSITAQYATATVYTSTPSDNLKQYLTVEASYNDGNKKTLTANEYELSGTLTVGTPTITASYTEGGVTKTATFTPAVTAVVLDSITANYTDGDVEINSNIDDLKTALTVTAHYNDGSVPTVSEYTLSSNSPFTAIGSKTITVTYEGKTDTFTVTVVCSNHDWGNWTPLTSATCTTVGSETQTCSICGTTETRPTAIDPTAHDYQWVTIAPSVIEEGMDKEICSHDATHIGEKRNIVSSLPITTTAEWNNALTLLNEETGNFTLTIGGSFNVAGITTASFGTTSTSGITVTLKGNGTISLNSQGNMIRIGANQTLIIDSTNLTLAGRSNNASTVYLDGSSSKLELRNGTINGNNAAYNQGGGIYVNGGIFTMSGGTISNNISLLGIGAGVFISSNGTFIMTGGEISNNTYGSGVTVGTGIFEMAGGIISGNTSSGTNSSGGGGVRVGSGGIFTMTGGKISGNSVINNNGGGVKVENGGTFRIVTGTVYGSDEGLLSNTTGSNAQGATLYNTGTAQRGTFIGSTWTSKGNLITSGNYTDDTISVVDGELE